LAAKVALTLPSLILRHIQLENMLRMVELAAERAEQQEKQVSLDSLTPFCLTTSTTTSFDPPDAPERAKRDRTELSLPLALFVMKRINASNGDEHAG
jgi:hypothetical protein